MYMKQILSLAALAGASADGAGRDLPDRIDRALQLEGLEALLPPAIGCLLAQREDPAQAAATCCPCADPDDGICSILWCMNLAPDDLSLKDQGTCSCDQTRDGCAQMAPFLPLVEGLTEVCAEVNACCPGEGATDADAFNGCMYEALDAGRIAAPNLDALGGVPVFVGDGVCEEEEEAATADATADATAADPVGSAAPAEQVAAEASEAGGDAAATTAEAATTAATVASEATEMPVDTDAAEAPAGGGGGDGDETDGGPESDASGDAGATGAPAEGGALASLPPSATCMLMEPEPAQAAPKCCPCADPNDGLCSILWCMNLEPDDLSLKDGGTCDCDQIREGCAQVEPLFGLAAGLVEGLPEVCAEIKGCCPAGGATASDAFNGCMYEGLDEGRIAVPNLDAIGGIPVLEGDGICPEEPAAGDAIDEDITDGEPDIDSYASKYDISPLVALVGSSLAIMMA